MLPEYVDHLAGAAAAGLGLTLVGLLNLLPAGPLARVGRSAAACGGALAGAAVWPGTPGAVWAAGEFLAVGVVVCLVLGSPRSTAAAAWAAGRLGRPGGRWYLAVAAGVGMVAAGLVRFETAQEQVFEEDARFLDLATQGAAPPVGETVPAWTDRGARVPAGVAATRLDDRAAAEAEAIFLAHSPFARALIRREPPCSDANCHGWVFTGGRYLVPGAAVDRILADNGYRPVTEPRPDDLVVYRGPGGVIAHSAVVRYVTAGMPVLVESKWGVLGVFLHPVDQSCYGTDYTYYRSPRTGHRLAETAPPVGELPAGGG